MSMRTICQSGLSMMLPITAVLTNIREAAPARIVSQTSITDANDILQWQLYGGFHVPSLTWANPDSVRDMLLPAR